MAEVIELPSKVSISYSRRQFVVRYGYSEQVRYFQTLEPLVLDIVAYYMHRKVSSVMTDLSGILTGINAARDEVMSDLKALTPALESKVRESENLRELLKREVHYRISKKAPPTAHVAAVNECLKAK